MEGLWYPRKMDDIAAWWANFKLRKSEFKSKYAVLLAEDVALDAAAAWVEYWVSTRHVFDDMSKQLTQYFGAISGNDPTLDPPAPITWTLPAGKPDEIPPGLEKFIRDIRREVVGLTNYSKADGAALGFESAAAPKPDPMLVKPEIKVFGAASGYHFSVVVSNRGDSNMWDVYIQRKGGGWAKIDSASGKSADIHVTPLADGDPEQLQVRVQLRKANADYGQVSDPAYVTVNP